MSGSGADEKRIIYGQVEDYLVALPAARVGELAALNRALRESKTWGQLRANVPVDEFDRILELSGDAETADEAPFKIESSIPSWYDGDYPPWPAQEMLARLPKKLIDQFVSSEDSRLNGEFSQIDLGREAEFVAALQALGYSSTRDDSVMRQISGYSDKP
jgi:hypothetical protein